MKDPDPVSICAGDLSLIQWVMLIGSIPILSPLLGIWAFQVLGSYGILGFGLYYVGVLYLFVQWLHFATRRR